MRKTQLVLVLLITNPVIYAEVSIIIIITGLLACYVPAQAPRGLLTFIAVAAGGRDEETDSSSPKANVKQVSELEAVTINLFHHRR